MRELNILPDEQKKNLSFSIALRVVVFFSYWLIGAAIVFGVLLLPAYFFITFQQREIERARGVEEELQRATHIGDVEERVRALNSRIRIFIERESQKKDTAPLIQAILNEAPAGVSLSFLSYKADTREMHVNGKAATRAFLLRFIEAMRAMPGVRDLSSPVANLIKEQDIDFTLTLSFLP